ncbi:hypothetical protein [Pseudogemmobacter faecipullorum]|uniref:Uncharacterized protein n=1 Tax=Pseudogemmobacter faecipullorum TaxID=2755041 RepID=A0ABS8CQ47_9RHOB|nr:hypothetical protein [Pseudogemmobacter faecipullorum]MCB5411514.1 hypothetical protein [Pseudogemmobacter faecipullorum]
MTDREHIYTCESCGAPIYAGDKACRFYTDAAMCAEHAMKLSDALREYQHALEGGYSLLENEDFDEEFMLQQIAKLELQIAREGDGPAALVKA